MFEVAKKFYKGNSISAADKLLSDFRKGFLGFGSLECPSEAPLLPISATDRLSAATIKESKKAELKRENRIGINHEITASIAAAEKELDELEEERIELTSEEGITFEEVEIAEAATPLIKTDTSLSRNIGRGKYEGW